MILELKDICKDYIQGKMVIPVLKHIDFQMEQGEYVTIMGPSGSARSLCPLHGYLHCQGLRHQRGNRQTPALSYRGTFRTERCYHRVKCILYLWNRQSEGLSEHDDLTATGDGEGSG